MPIQILDNFEVNVAKPIDNRFVVGSQSFYQNKEQIPYRYPGLRIWDLNDNFPYVWTGATWSNENQSGTVIGSGDAGRLPKFIGSSPTSNITNSLIFDNGTNIGINTISPTDRLHVVGNIRSTGPVGFIGGGSQITALNASNITSGSLSLSIITAGLSGQIMVRGTSHAEFVNSSTLTVGSSTNVIISNDTSSTTDHNITFVSGTGSQTVKINTTNTIRIKPSTGNVGIGGNPQSYKLYINGGVSIGNIASPPSNGLRVQGGCVLSPDLSLAGVSIGTTTAAQNRGLRILGSAGNYATQGNIVIQGNGGIATTAVHLDFDIIGTGTANPRFFRNTNTTGDRGVTFYRGNGTFTADAQIGVGGTKTFFSTDPDSIFYIGSESLTHTPGGTFGTDGNGVLQVTSKNSGVAVDGASFKPVNNTNHIINFVNTSGVNRGKIRGVSTSAVAYETNSDLRLKRNITDMNSMIEKIKMLKPSNYKWRIDESDGFGFIAQEVYQVFPELRPTINSYCDTDCKEFDLDNPIDKNGNPYYYGLDYGSFTPFLTKALQEVIQNYDDLIDKIKNSASLDDLKGSL